MQTKSHLFLYQNVSTFHTLSKNKLLWFMSASIVVSNKRRGSKLDSNGKELFLGYCKEASKSKQFSFQGQLCHSSSHKVSTTIDKSFKAQTFAKGNVVLAHSPNSPKWNDRSLIKWLKRSQSEVSSPSLRKQMITVYQHLDSVSRCCCR